MPKLPTKPSRRGKALVALAVLWAAVGLLAPAGCSSDSRQPGVILITLDTTRPDALGCGGGFPGLTPSIDRIASEGIYYTEARTTAPMTIPAHASMMTGLYPIRHAARDNGLTPLPGEATTLAERAEAAGIETTAFVASAALDSGLGIAQGFGTYVEPPLPGESGVSARYPEYRAGEVVANVERWLESRRGDGPFLLWVHFFDPHHPYDPPVMPEVARGNPYLAEVAFMDGSVGRLRDALEQRGLWARSLVIVVADHGESLGQHGEPSHGVLCYDSTMRVPMIVRYPDGYGAGRRSSEIVSVVDVFPTALEALGLAEPGDIDGQSLYRREVSAERGVYFESYYGYLQHGWSPIVGWVDSRGKYMHGARQVVFDVTADRAESAPAAVSEQDLARYRREIESVSGRDRLTAGGPVDEQVLERLASLGYVSGGTPGMELPEPLADTGLPDPETRGEELARLYASLGLGEQGRFEEAISGLRQVLADNPNNNVAREQLATYLVHLGRCPEALIELRAILERGIERGSTQNSLGHCLLEGGDPQQALGHFERAMELDPSNPIPPTNVAVALEQLGRVEEARRFHELASRARAR